MDSKTVKSYRDLLCLATVDSTLCGCLSSDQQFPREELYGLTAQLRRAAVSVASNIAEGYGRGSKGEYTNFLGMARGSVLEVQTQLVIAEKLGFAAGEKLSNAALLSEETGKMLWAMIANMRTTKAGISDPAPEGNERHLTGDR
ncbi:MAG TPA: four helix bundle protein [Acidobacteriaceae bacterium]|nr:four helix bundle protein [Acidobacteriaceae bacterium]